MGGKKKNLANKLAKMSDEERARYLQHRADIEEEQRRKKEQLISTFMKNKVKREDGFARLNLAKINQNWHQLLRKDKCKQLKDNVLHMKEYIDRMISNKNRTIEYFLQQLEEAEEQYGYNYQCHITQIDNIIKTQDDYLNEIKHQYEEDRQELLDVANEEMDEIIKKNKDDIAYLKTLSFGQQFKGNKALLEQYEFYKTKIFKILNQNESDMRKLRNSREQTSGDLWTQMAETLRDYTRKMDVTRSHLAELEALDAESANEILYNQDSIERKEEEIIKLKKLYDAAIINGKDEIDNLKSIMKELSKKTFSMKVSLTKTLSRDEKKFNRLVETSNDTIEYLENTLGRGNQILLLVDICKKFETEDDLVKLLLLKVDLTDEEEKEELPEISTTLNITATTKDIASKKVVFVNREQQQYDISTLEKFKDENKTGIIENTFEALGDMEMIWEKYNNVVLNYSELRKERRDLLRNNEEVKASLRKLLEKIIMDKSNNEVVVMRNIKFRNVKSAPALANRVNLNFS